MASGWRGMRTFGFHLEKKKGGRPRRLGDGEAEEEPGEGRRWTKTERGGKADGGEGEGGKQLARDATWK